MKKLLCLFAVFALTAPVFAAEGDPNVAVTCNDLGGGLVQVSYAIQYEDGLDPAARVRGFAFDITTTNGCLISAISEYDAEGASVPADSTQIPALYSVYMGSIQFATDPNYVSLFGDPVAPSGPPKNYPDTLGGLGTTGITVEMGSLYPEGGTQPPASGNLFKIQLTDPTSAGSCELTIIGNGTRGECVLEDGSPGNIVSAGCTINFDCFTGTPEQVAAWNFWGKPANWCEPCFKCGDVNSSTSITPSDWFKVFDDLKAQSQGATHDGTSDVNMSGSLTPSDWFFVWDQLKAGVVCSDPACQ